MSIKTSTEVAAAEVNLSEQIDGEGFSSFSRKVLSSETEPSISQAALPKLLDLFARQVAARPDAVAVVYQARRVTYRELDDWSNRLAHWLIERHALDSGETPLIPFCLRRGPDQIAVLLSILKVGGAYVPLDRQAPPNRNRFILQDIKAKVLITDSATCQDMAALLAEAPAAITLLNLDEELSLIRSFPTGPLEMEDAPYQPCYIMYTSGSTGRPKGVIVPRCGVVRLVHDTNYFEATPADVFSQAASISFDAATFEIWGALLNGARTIMVDTDVAVDPRRFRTLLEEERVSISFLTTGLFNQLVGANPAMFGGLRYLMFGGEAASADTVRRLLSCENRPKHLYNVYGPTENTTYSTFHPILTPPEPGSAIPIGQAINGSSCYVVNERLELAPPGSTGELLVGGIGVALGYVGDARLTAQKFISSPFEPGDLLYRTGDLVQQSGDRVLTFVGRVDNQVKIRGFRIEVEEVELALDSHPDLAEAAVIVEDDVTGTKRLAAYLRIAEGCRTPSAAELRAHLEQSVPPYMVPGVFRLVNHFPLGLTGKVDRRALAAMPAETLASEAAVLEPRNSLEAEIRQLWAAQLGLAPAMIGVETNFFTLGGQSLVAAAIVMKLAESRGIDLRLGDMLAAPTIAELARAVANAPSKVAIQLPQVARHDDLPLSWSQEQIWLHQQASPESAYYNEPLDIAIPEQISPQILEQALAAVLDRHESLRLRLDTTGGSPRQRVEPLGPFRLQLADLRHLSPAKRGAESRRLATSIATKPFDLARELPIRFLLVRLEDARYRLYLTGHHIALDGVGMFQVFLPELEMAYRMIASGKKPQWSPLPFSWRDWLVWQRDSKPPQEWAAQLDYWATQLASLEILDLPTDRTRNAEERFEGARLPLELGAHLTSRLKDLARGQSTSLFAVLLAAFKTLLHRYTNQADIAVGSVVSGRGLAGLDRHVCDTLNTIVLRTRVPQEVSFLNLLADVHRTCVDGFANQDVPFQLVARRFSIDPSRERSVPIQVAFVLEPGIAPSPAGWEMNQLEIHTGTAKFDLTMELDERGDRIIGRVEYRSDLFNETTIERFVQHYRILLEGIAANPATPITRLPLLDDEERRRILVTWNDTAVNYEGPPTLHQLIERRASEHPETQAIIQGSRVVSFRELVDGARRIAHRLQKQGVRIGNRVGVWTDRSPEHLIAQLGVLMAGGAYVPLAADEPAERAALILKDAGVRAVLVDRDRDRRLANFEAPRLLADESTFQEQEAEPLRVVQPSDIAYIIYTSGSSGRPKGAQIDHRAIVDRTLAAGALMQTGPNDIAIHLFSLAFDGALLPTWWMLGNGGAVVIPTSEELQNPDVIAELVQRHHVNHVCATPAFWEVLTGSMERKEVRLYCASAGGDRFTRNLWQRLRSFADRVINMYGPTEATVAATFWESETLDCEAPPIGSPFANTRLYVLDSQGQPVPVGIRGDLYIGGAGTGRGYLNLPERTAAAFVPDPFHGGTMYRTGDIVRWLPTGEIDYLGRADQQVKIRGFRIELGEIEGCLQAHPRVKQCAVVVRQEAQGKRLVAYLVGDENADIKAYLRDRLPPPMVPSAIVFLPFLPLTQNGKIDRRALPDPVFETQHRDAQPLTALGRLEQRLLDYFRGALGSALVGPMDDFFEAGGDSIGAMQLAAKATSSGLRLSVRDLLKHRTVMALAAALRQSNAAERFSEHAPVFLTSGDPLPTKATHDIALDQHTLRAESALISFREEGDLPPLFFVHPAGGSAVCYRTLAEHLPSQAFYGLECVEGYAGKTIESMAAEYLAVIRKIQPRGPYFVGGWSFGGNIAFEMARQIEAGGIDTVGLVALIDSRPLTHPLQLAFLRTMNEDSAAMLCLIARHFAQISGHEAPVSYAELQKVPEAERRDYLMRSVARANLFPRDIANAFTTRFAYDFAACVRIFSEYRLTGKSHADVLLLRASEKSSHYAGFPAMEEPLAETTDPTYGWGALTAGRVTVHSTTGTHETCVFAPHVGAAAAHIRTEMGRKLGRARHFDALPTLTAAQWSTVLAHTDRHTVPAGTLLIEKGASDRNVYLIGEGLLEILSGDSPRRIAEVGAGTVLGEIAFIDGQPRTASVRALTEVSAYSLTPESFRRLEKAAPELASIIAFDLARVVAQRLRERLV